MTTIGDGGAVADDGRVFDHHKLAVQLVGQYLTRDLERNLRVFDVACGRGQFIRSMKRSLSQPSLGRIRYLGYDVEQQYAKEAVEVGGSVGLCEAVSVVGELSDLAKLVHDDEKFGLICLTNTLHELAWEHIPNLIIELIKRIEIEGSLFIYDVETESPPELGAITWQRDEIQRVIDALLRELGSRYEPMVIDVPARSTEAWSVTIEHRLLGVDFADIEGRSEDAVAAANAVAGAILDAKLKACTDALEALTGKGVETVEEESFRDRLLFRYWALNRVKDRQQ